VADRSNQKARTRAALLDAAVALVAEGRSPSVPDAAERALVSVATAYRYFPSADELWYEAAASEVEFDQTQLAADELIRAENDPRDRLEAAVRTVGFHMVEHQVPYRHLARAALDRWFEQADTPTEERAPVREQRRKRHLAMVVEPLRGTLPDADVDRLEHALGMVLGTDAMLAVTDGMGLEGAAAQEAMLDGARWLLAGALAEFDATRSG